MSTDDQARRRVSAVLPAGGTGSRMNLPVPKQFVEIEGRPLFSYALETFVEHPLIERVVLVIPPAFRDHVTEFLASQCANANYAKVTLVDGAETRHRSIWNGIKALEKLMNGIYRGNGAIASHDAADDSFTTSLRPCHDLVVIHDAARPLLDAETLEKVIDAAWSYGAAGVIRPLVSTVLRPDEKGFLKETLVRDEFRASEMPQAFSLSLIGAAYSRCSDDDLDYGTECLEIARKYGDAKVKLVDGGENLWKVTYAKDLDALRTCLRLKKAQQIDKE